MEQHQMPRQITTFEFKLIGFMTLTQFIYLIVFLPLSYVVYSLFPVPIINILLAFAVALIGLALAFLPINSRPLDIWVKNLYKRLISPTQFYYHKQGGGLEFIQNLYFDVDPHKVEAHVASQDALNKYLSTKKETYTPLEVTPPSFLSHLEEKKLQIASILQKPYELLVGEDKSLFAKAPAGNNDAAGGADAEEEFVRVDGLKSSEEPKERNGGEEKTSEATGTKKGILEERHDVETEQKKALNEKEPDEVVERLRELSKDEKKPIADETDKKPASAEASAGKPSSVMDHIGTSERKEEYRTVKKPAEKKPFFAGVVKNTKNIPLPGILIYVKEEGNDHPLRLLKTNPYGVFATYNPLRAGTYFFEVRDPKGLFYFDTMKIEIKDENNESLEFYSN